jgi:chromosome segregation ATPase
MSSSEGEVSGPPERETDGRSISMRDLRRENAKLSQTNVDLTNQVKSLRRQFDQALSISTTVDDLMAKCTESTRELARLKTERDDLAHRLQSALQANQELKSTLDELKRHFASEASASCRQQKQKLEDTVRQLSAELSQERRQKEALKGDCEQFELHFEKLYQAAGSYFGTLVDSHQALLDCFLQGTRRVDEEKHVEALQQSVSSLSRKEADSP